MNTPSDYWPQLLWRVHLEGDIIVALRQHVLVHEEQLATLWIQSRWWRGSGSSNAIPRSSSCSSHCAESLQGGG